MKKLFASTPASALIFKESAASQGICPHRALHKGVGQKNQERIIRLSKERKLFEHNQKQQRCYYKFTNFTHVKRS
jgi:hypothetical protein